jgi:hypothetical protein
MRKGSLRVAVTMAVVAGSAITLGQPAMAADTTTTFDIEAGTLSISAPAARNLGPVPVGGTSISNTLGNVVVTDARALVAATWSATVTIPSPFTNGTTTIANTAVFYFAPAGTVTGAGTGTATGTGGSTPIDTGATAQTFTGSGATTTTWDPTLSINLTGATAGHYTGTVTHSVA